MTDTQIDQLTEQIIGCGIEVHRTLGAGLLESVYRECLMIELRGTPLNAIAEQCVKIDYKGVAVKSQLRLDLLVEECIVVELKAVESIHPVHVSQVITYLKLAGYPAGLIMNFNVSSLRRGIRRVDHPDRYRDKPRLAPLFGI